MEQVEEASNTVVREYLYEVEIPITSEGLLIEISKGGPEGPRFAGYQKYSDGAKGPAEAHGAFVAIGDRFVFVDGVNCEGMSNLAAMLLCSPVAQDDETPTLPSHKQLVMSHIGARPPTVNNLRYIVYSRSDDGCDRPDTSGRYFSGGRPSDLLRIHIPKPQLFQQNEERQRSVRLYMILLLHAAECKSPKCPSANCAKMKGLLKHLAKCKVKATGGSCNVCKRIWSLLRIHARQCKAKQCAVPKCVAIRERVCQLKSQEQTMDDRRRRGICQKRKEQRSQPTNAADVQNHQVDPSPEDQAHRKKNALAVLHKIQIGARLAVFWPLDDEYYSATVVTQASNGTQVSLLYDDGDTEWIDLTEHDFKLLPGQRRTKDPMRLGMQDSERRKKNALAALDMIQIGTRLDVFWPLDNQYYSATVVSQGSNATQVSLLYDDGDTEWIDLTEHDFKLLPGQRRTKNPPQGGRQPEQILSEEKEYVQILK